MNKLTARIGQVIEPFQGPGALTCTIPGISILTADVIIAETGADMTRFPPPSTWLPGSAPHRGTTNPPGR